MKKKEDEQPDRIDIDLDSEPISESPLELVEAAAEAAADTPAEAGLTDSQEAQALMLQLSRLQTEKDDLTQTLIRRQADFENFRKRVDRERKEDHARFASIFAETLLPILDGFERALAADSDPANASVRQGYELIHKQLMDSLAKMGLEAIDAVGKPFDPFYHQAVERVESDDVQQDTVIEELMRGYKFKDKVLRPTMARVAVPRAGTNVLDFPAGE